jgi:hypothetical protein
VTDSRLPIEVETVFNDFFTCEFSTISKDGTPITWPVLPVYLSSDMSFIILSSIGLSLKTHHILREPRVSLLFSESIGSNLANPPAVLVQGKACVREEILVSFADYSEELLSAIKAQTRKIMRDQPALGIYLKNPLMRFLMDWYFMRLIITIRPQRILWWDKGDFSQIPHELEVVDVE